MNFNAIGKGVLGRTNSVELLPDSVFKQYRALSVPMLWAGLERKALAGKRTRYEREKRLLPFFHENGLHTPELVTYNDSALVLGMRREELTGDLAAIFEDKSVHPDDKRQLLVEAFWQLYKIHSLGETHGDAYLKNFSRTNSARGPVFTYDFELTRTGPDPQMFDVVLLAANAAGTLRDTEGAIDALRNVYGRDVSFPFDARDNFFLTSRFRVGPAFFEYFS